MYGSGRLTTVPPGGAGGVAGTPRRRRPLKPRVVFAPGDVVVRDGACRLWILLTNARRMGCQFRVGAAAVVRGCFSASSVGMRGLELPMVSARSVRLESPGARLLPPGRYRYRCCARVGGGRICCELVTPCLLRSAWISFEIAAPPPPPPPFLTSLEIASRILWPPRGLQCPTSRRVYRGGATLPWCA